MTPLVIEGDPAAILASLAVIAAALWKVRLWMRQDKRADKSAETQHEAHDDLVMNLREEVGRLYELIEDMGKRLDAEMRLRRDVENENATLKRRVADAERRIAELEGKVP